MRPSTEVTTIYITAVDVPPSTNTEDALTTLDQSEISANMNFAARGDQVSLDQVYTNLKPADRAVLLHPHPGNSNHL